MPDFSFEQDVAPYASRFFARTQANPLLSTAKKTQLTGDLLDKLEGFKKAADEDDERSLQKEIRRTQLDRERIALDDARLDFQEKREAAELEPVVSAEFDKLFDGVDDANEQQRRLGLFAMRNSRVISKSPSLAAKYKFAADAITKPAFSSKDIYEMRRQAERDAISDRKWQISEDRRGETAEARIAREERAQLDRVFDVKLEADEAEQAAAISEKRAPKVKFTNRADRSKMLNFLAEYGNDVSTLEDAEDEKVFEAADRFKRKLITGRSSAAKTPILSFD